MPAKHAIKCYVEGGYYHIYNRGVEKREIFIDKKDYSVFLRFLKEYLLPPDHKDLVEYQQLYPRRKPINCHDDIKLIAYCLMPNHFHLFIKQITHYGLKTFMKALLTNYVVYFNKRYNRVGHLFQGIYKGALIETEPYYIHISRYIHRNPLELHAGDHPLHEYPYSSYRYYLSGQSPDWIDINEILKFFSSSKSLLPSEILSYRHFVENYDNLDKKDIDILGELILE